MRILVTGFEVFGKNNSNPSMDIINNLKLDNVYTLLLPVSYDRVSNLLENKIKEIKPDIVLSLGLAQGRDYFSLELCALNYMKASISDNDNVLYNGKLIDCNKDKAYFTKFNIIDFNEYLNSNNIKSYVSTNAGTYVCNRVYFYNLSNEDKYNYKSLFIHVPGYDIYNLDEQLESIKFIINNLDKFIS